MHERQVYEYAVIRVVPRPEREEFLNVGVILYCKRAKFLKAICHLDASRLLALFPMADESLIRDNLSALEAIAAGNPSAGPIARMEKDERFRWLTAIRSTMIQSSRPHPGLTGDPETCLNRLYNELIL